MLTERIFISSVQKELQAERRALRDFLRGDALLSQFFDVFLFEGLPASGRRADEVYLDEVRRCALYVGLFGQEYGTEDAAGFSPTEREFDEATAKGKERLILVKEYDDAGRHPKMQALIRKASDYVIRRRFSSVPELTAALYASLVDRLMRNGVISSLPFDAQLCSRATLEDLSRRKISEFLSRAQYHRGYKLKPGTPLRKALAHLNLLEGGKPTNAAILLFGKNPQKFFITSEVKCMRFHGVDVRKPIPAYSIYKGTLFEMIDEAVDFVMSKIDRTVGARTQSVQAPVTYELPLLAVTEAIVNACTHRQYTSNASV